MSLDDIIKLNIFNLFGAGALPEGKRRQILADMTQMLLERVVMRIADALAPDKKEEFYRVFGGVPSSDDEKRAFLSAHVADFNDIILQEVLAFKYAVAQFAEERGIESASAA